MKTFAMSVLALIAGTGESAAQDPPTSPNLPICGSLDMSSRPSSTPPRPRPGTTPPGAPPGSVPPSSTTGPPTEPCVYIPGTPWTGSIGTLGEMQRVAITGPNLIVPAGSVATLPAQRWEFDRIEIQQGGVLRITPGGLSRLELVVRGPMIFRGTIEATNFDTAELTHTGVGPNGNPIELAFKNDNLGGRGGSGGTAGVRSGGLGAAGTTMSGGGGGSGALDWNGRYPRPFSRDGNPGVQERGGEAMPLCHGKGADGSRRATTGNGGVVFLLIDGDFDGSGGLVDLRGSAGGRGGDGYPLASYNDNTCGMGSGGGGGGGPGGQGGYLLARIRGQVLGYPVVLTEGGLGGPGGRPNGHAGDKGRSGAAHWFKVGG